MFGGHGLYHEGRYFGVISDGVLYFRTDDTTRGDYVKRGMEALQPKHQPRGPKTIDRNFRVPDEVYARPATLRRWAIKAAAARR